MTDTDDLVTSLLNGEQWALARAITRIENRNSGHRDIVSKLYDHTGNADIIGVTGRPGAGKSTLVDKLAATYREDGQTVGVIAVDPSSPYTGGSVLGDRVRMKSNRGDMGMFFRSMSARGRLGGLSTTTTDAIRALDAFGKDKVIVETVGAGQNEVDIVTTADTVLVLIPPASGDDVQMLKAGILEIADVFVVNKADKDGVDRTVRELQHMIETTEDKDWEPRIVETVATDGEGIDDLVDAIGAHQQWLSSEESGRSGHRARIADEIRTVLRSDSNGVLAEAVDKRGGIDSLVDSVVNGEQTPYDVSDEILRPLREAIDQSESEEKS